MKFQSITLPFILLISVPVFASSQLSRLQQIDPNNFDNIEQMCTQWAEDDQIESTEKSAHIESCILNELGYLLEATEGEQLDQENTSEENSHQAESDSQT